MQRQTAKSKKKKWADTLVILLVFAVPAAAALWGIPLWDGLGQNAARLSVSMNMPEAGVDVMLNHLTGTPTDDLDNLIDTGDIIDGNLPTQEQLPGLTDVEAASILIPESRRGIIETSRFASRATGTTYFNMGNGCIRNTTNFSNADMQTAAAQPLPFDIELGSNEPQVLILHTHSTESYDRFDAGFYDTDYPSRSTDITENINAVGKVMADYLNANGIRTIHATEYHDYPSYNGAYTRSRETAEYYLSRYPSIKVVLDVHRDAIEREGGTRVKPTTAIDGQKAAQIMIICSAGSSANPYPAFRQNLSFAAHLQDTLETLYPTLTRPVKLAHTGYNADLTTGSLLLEMGGHANTLEEAVYTGELTARALAQMFGAI